MKEHELIAWVKPSVEDGLKEALRILNNANSLKDFKEFHKQMKFSAKELKITINAMETYLSVAKAINECSD